MNGPVFSLGARVALFHDVGEYATGIVTGVGIWPGDSCWRCRVQFDDEVEPTVVYENQLVRVNRPIPVTKMNENEKRVVSFVTSCGKRKTYVYVPNYNTSHPSTQAHDLSSNRLRVFVLE